MDKILHDPIRTLNYGNYGIFLTMSHAGFCPSTVLAKASCVTHNMAGLTGRDEGLGLRVEMQKLVR